MDMKSYTAQLLVKIRKSSPLVHNITNFVVMNSSANMLLAIGASPVMAHCISEVEEMTSMADALVLNIGTLDENWVDAMILAAGTANSKKIPVIFDPVGAGATKLRTDMTRKIIQESKISVLRGNGSEIFSLISDEFKTRGVDSSVSIDRSIIEPAITISREFNAVIAISGKEDMITDGKTTYCVANGHPIMTRVTGIGCGLTAIVAAFCARSDGDLLPAVAAAHGFYGLCGELAHESSHGPGSFFVRFIDLLHRVGEKEIFSGLCVNEIS
jgi:hydroxyethylthiazole kinase